MAEVQNSRLNESLGGPRSPGAPRLSTGSGNAENDSAGRAAKKQRLRELQNEHDSVRTIVVHIGKHYQNIDLPAWLDLTVVSGHLARSGTARQKSSSHAAWKYLRESTSAIREWMGQYDNWREAVKQGRMPYIGLPSEIKAVEFIHGKGPYLPNCIMQQMVRIGLDYLVDHERRPDDKIAEFWRVGSQSQLPLFLPTKPNPLSNLQKNPIQGAKVDDRMWRLQHMQNHGYQLRIPFKDDLNDLVRSVVRHKNRPDQRETSHQPGEPGSDEAGHQSNDLTKEASGAAAAAMGNISKTKGKCAPWENKVQAAMSRINDTVSEALATERKKLLGKRPLEGGGEMAQAEPHRKRSKAAPVATHPAAIADSIENGDDDEDFDTPPPARGTATAEDERFRLLKINYKKLRRQDQQLVTRFCGLDHTVATMGKDVEQLTKQQKDLRRDVNATKQKQQRFNEGIGKLEAESKGLDEKAQHLTVQCSALTDNVRKLEDKGEKVTAQCSALGDENKLLRAKITDLTSRIETLEKAKSAPEYKHAAMAAAVPDTAAETDRSRQSAGAPAREQATPEALRDRTFSVSRDIPHGTAASAILSPRGPSYEAHIQEEPRHSLPPRECRRSIAQFPRVLDMPTFEPTWNPREEINRRRAPVYPSVPPREAYQEVSHARTDYAPELLQSRQGSDEPEAESYPVVMPRGLTPTPLPTQAPAPAQRPDTAPAYTHAPFSMGDITTATQPTARRLSHGPASMGPPVNRLTHPEPSPRGYDDIDPALRPGGISSTANALAGPATAAGTIAPAATHTAQHMSPPPHQYQSPYQPPQAPYQYPPNYQYQYAAPAQAQPKEEPSLHRQVHPKPEDPAE